MKNASHMGLLLKEVARQLRSTLNRRVERYGVHCHTRRGVLEVSRDRRVRTTDGDTHAVALVTCDKDGMLGTEGAHVSMADPEVIRRLVRLLQDGFRADNAYVRKMKKRDMSENWLQKVMLRGHYRTP